MTSAKIIPSSAERAAMPASAPAPAIALIKPQMGENIGAACRSMANFGLEELYIVKPRDGWPNEKATAVAAGANWVLDNAKIHNTTNEATSEKTIIFATSGTPRQLSKPLISPQKAVELIAEAMAKGEKPIVLFGNERIGLDQIDLVSADYIVTYPTDFKFPSLNLAQSVAIFCFLWATRDGIKMPKGWNIEMGEIAPRKYFDNLLDFLITELDECGFFWPLDKRENMVESLRNSLVRARFSESEINLFRGAMRVIAEGPRRRFTELKAQEAKQKLIDWLMQHYPNAKLHEIVIEKPRAIAIINENNELKTIVIEIKNNQFSII